MKLAVIVPVKPPNEAKSRLATVLTPGKRLAVARHLCERTLDIVEGWSPADLRLVVSRDADLLADAHGRGWIGVREEVAGLNSALTQATARAVCEGVDALLVIPSDLPLLTTADLDGLATLAEEGTPVVVIAPCRRGDGTNALLLCPPDAIPFAFGPDSFAEHCRLAEMRHIPARVFRSPTVALDLDTPEDLQAATQE